MKITRHSCSKVMTVMNGSILLKALSISKGIKRRKILCRGRRQEIMKNKRKKLMRFITLWHSKTIIRNT